MSENSNRTSIIESVKIYLSGCPFLQDGKLSQVEGTEYHIDSLTGSSVYKRYVDGSELKQFRFLLVTKQPLASNVREVLLDSGFEQYFEEWIQENNKCDIFPALDNYSPVALEILSSGTQFMDGGDQGRYQMECRLIYQ